MVTWKLMGDALRKAKMDAAKNPTPGSEIIITVILSPSNSAN